MGGAWLGRGAKYPTNGLHPLVVGAASAFGHDPINDQVPVRDVACLAMHAIRCIDFQLQAFAIFHHFLDHRRAKVLGRGFPYSSTPRVEQMEVPHLQVARLILLMSRSRVI